MQDLHCGCIQRTPTPHHTCLPADMCLPETYVCRQTCMCSSPQPPFSVPRSQGATADAARPVWQANRRQGQLPDSTAGNPAAAPGRASLAECQASALAACLSCHTCHCPLARCTALCDNGGCVGHPKGLQQQQPVARAGECRDMHQPFQIPQDA